MAGESSKSQAAGGSSNTGPQTPTASRNDNGEGGSRPTGVVASTSEGPRQQSLVDVMREPSTRRPDPVILNTMPVTGSTKPALNPKEDLWLSTADDRYTSPIIPIRVGEIPDIQTFYVHQTILMAHDWFRAALSGKFKESPDEGLDLPAQDPSIFQFLVAFLYEGRYDPIKPISSALDPDTDKGKGRETNLDEQGSDYDSATSIGSDSSARSQRRRERRRRRADRQIERMREKHPGQHRPDCTCQQCMSLSGPPCWACGSARMPPNMFPPAARAGADNWRHMPTRHRTGPRDRPANNPNTAVVAGNGTGSAETVDPYGGGRIQGEDLRTWLLAYELCVEVYICADHYLIADFKTEVARALVDMLETAGSDAAQPRVLASCARLAHTVGESDPLSRMVLARAGFMQSALWGRFPQETSEFLLAHPDVAAMMLREMASRRDDEHGGRALPSMQRVQAAPAAAAPHHAHHPHVWDPYTGMYQRHGLRGTRF